MVRVGLIPSSVVYEMPMYHINKICYLLLFHCNMLSSIIFHELKYWPGYVFNTFSVLFSVRSVLG